MELSSGGLKYIVLFVSVGWKTDCEGFKTPLGKSIVGNCS